MSLPPRDNEAECNAHRRRAARSGHSRWPAACLHLSSIGSHGQRLAEIAVRDTVPVSRGTIVGFLAKSHGERLIHPGERLHLHVVLPNEQRMGHLESVTIVPGATLRLPRTSPTPPSGA